MLIYSFLLLDSSEGGVGVPLAVKVRERIGGSEESDYGVVRAIQAILVPFHVCYLIVKV